MWRGCLIVKFSILLGEFSAYVQSAEVAEMSEMTPDDTKCHFSKISRTKKTKTTLGENPWLKMTNIKLVFLCR